MTDEGQLALDGLAREQPAIKKSARKRRPAKPQEKDEVPAPTEPTKSAAPVEVSAPVVVAAPAEPVAEAPAEAEPERPRVEADKPTSARMASDKAAAPVATAHELEPVAKKDPAATVVSVPVRLFFLTNRMNLNGLLSSRLLAPRESFHKYYADLLELSPGWVPILAGPPPAELIERVVAERGAGAPVLVELSESVLNGQQQDGPVVYVRAAALADVEAIHFHEEKSLREHHARRYSNVFPHTDLLRVSPELFSGGPDTEVIATPSEAPETDWSQIDRVRGAISAAMAAADSGEAMAIAAGLLGATSLPKDTIVPPWLSWAGLTSETAEPTSEADAERADRLIFQAAYRVLGERDQAESWSPSEALEATAADISAANPSAEVNAIIQRNLKRMRELVNVERDFERFRNPGSPYVAAKSFLMVLLRPDLAQLLEWPAEETGTDATTRVVAAVLAGRLRGVARESVKLRNLALDDRTAAWAIQTATGQTSTLGIAEFVADDAKASVVIDGVRLQTSPPLRF